MTITIFATVVGFGLVIIAMVMVWYSAYRCWLNSMLAGMLCWGMIEIVRYSISYCFELAASSAYFITLIMAAIMASIWVVYQDQQEAKRIEQAILEDEKTSC